MQCHPYDRQPEPSGDKRDALRCLHAAIESFLAAHDMSREQLAEDVCGMSAANFSKVSHGLQGDFLGLLHEKLPAEIRHDYYERMAELERADPVLLAMEQLQAAMWRLIKVSGGQLPQVASHMAKVAGPVMVATGPVMVERRRA